jgi:hypothetical protein
MRTEVETATAFPGAANEDPLPLDAEREREVREFGRSTRKRRVQTLQVGSVRAKLRLSAEGHLAQAAAQIGGRPTERISDSDYATFKRSVDRAAHELEQERLLSTLEHRAEVVAEPGPYGPESPASYFCDLAASVTARIEAPDPLGARTSEVDMGREAVEERLRRHAVDVSLAIRKGDAYGKRCRAILNESFREEDPTACMLSRSWPVTVFTAAPSSPVAGTVSVTAPPSVCSAALSAEVKTGM